MNAQFNIVNDLYNLSFEGKVCITINGDIFNGSNAAKLREIIKSLNLEIPVFSKNGKNEPPNNLAQKIIRQLNSGIVKRKTNSDKSKDVDILSNKSDNYDSLSKVQKERLKDINTPKLLIISCSDAKQPGGNIIQIPNDTIGALLPQNFRINRRNYYNNLFINNQNHFIRPNGNNIFNRCNLANNNHLLMEAYNRYFGGIFYSHNLINNYLRINQNNNFHILIISGLYGVIEFRDHIIDYHLTIKKGGNWYQANIHNAVVNYMNINGISDKDVYYSLSNDYSDALNPNANWNNLWQGGGGHGRVSANYLDNFLSKI